MGQTSYTVEISPTYCGVLSSTRIKVSESRILTIVALWSFKSFIECSRSELRLLQVYLASDDNTASCLAANFFLRGVNTTNQKGCVFLGVRFVLRTLPVLRVRTAQAEKKLAIVDIGGRFLFSILLYRRNLHHICLVVDWPTKTWSGLDTTDHRGSMRRSAWLALCTIVFALDFVSSFWGFAWILLSVAWQCWSGCAGCIDC